MELDHTTAGADKRHQLLAANILAALGPQVGGHCRLKTYAFGVVVECDGSILVVDIFLPFEPDFESHQRAFGYRQNPEIKHTLLVDPARPGAILHSRSGNGWENWLFSSLEGVIALPAVGATLAMADIYKGFEIEAKG